MDFLRYLTGAKSPDKASTVVIESSGASTVSMLDTLLSEEGKKGLSQMADFAIEQNLRQPES